MAVTPGLLFGIFMGVGFYWFTPSRSAVDAVVAGVIWGAGFGTLMAVSPAAGSWLRVRQLTELPPSGRVAVLRAVRQGEPVTDPRLAPAVLAYAEVVTASAGKQQTRRAHWGLFAFAALELVMAVAKIITVPASLAVFFWLFAIMFFSAGRSLPGALRRQQAKAQVAAALAAEGRR